MQKVTFALCCFLVGNWLLAGVAAEYSSFPQPFDGESLLPYRARWGAYLVNVEAIGKYRVTANRVRITDQKGRVLKEINAAYVDVVDYPDLNGRGNSEFLRVTTAPENNTLANRRTYCFTRRGKLRNTLVMPYKFDYFRDLDGDGQPELFSDNYAPLEWLDSLCHACCPPVYLVLQRDRTRYKLANRRFPAAVLAQVEIKKQKFSQDVQAFQERKAESLTWEYLAGEAIGIYADLASIGQQHPARRWLQEQLPADFMRRGFAGMLPEVEQRLAELPAQITTSQHRVINAPR